MCFLLTEQWQGNRNQDGSQRKQKALPMLVLRRMIKLSNNAWEEAVTWLLVGAIFFAMRLCEYLVTSPNEGAKRMRILRLKNIQFLRNGKKIGHDHPDLQEC